jgi:pyruvate/2-oxoglutarate dehydrogenase complex dihydrolipoamide dehydrogenase (E3) component
VLRDDPFDQALLANVQPQGWKNPAPGTRYNLVVIGAGTAGLVTAAGAAGLGARVALIERAQLGGDCLNVGCVPSKALLRSAHQLAEIRDAASNPADSGVQISGEVQADFAAIMRRMRGIRARISPADSAERFQNELGVDIFLGDARFLSPKQLEVGGQTIDFKRAVITTGARAVVPPIPGLDETGYHTNETIFDLEKQPEHLVVLGGGPIGCELAQAFRRFGSEVTMLEMGTQFLPREDADAAQLLRASLDAEGIDIRLNTQLVRVEAGEDGRHRAHVVRGDGDGVESVIAFDQLLLAVGRAPNVQGLGLEEAGVDYDPRRGVVVDDQLRTSNKRIFAAGDICMQYKFTHAADFAARTVIQNALFFGRRKLSALTIPWCTYTDPEIAHVGLYPREAESSGVQIDTYTQPFSDVDRAIAEGRDEGFVKIHTAKGTDKILGATIVGDNAGDMISEISVAMAAGMGLGSLASVIHPYPTRAEAIRKVGDAYNRTRLTPSVARLFETILRWRR